MEKITKIPPPVPSKSFIAKRLGNPPAGPPAGHAESPVEKKDAFEALKAIPREADIGSPLGRRRSGGCLVDLIKQAKERPRNPPGTTAPRSAEEKAAFLDAMRFAGHAEPPLGRKRPDGYLADLIKQAKERPRNPPGTPAPRSAEEIAAFLDAMRSA